MIHSPFEGRSNAPQSFPKRQTFCAWYKFSLLTKKKRGGKAGFGALFVHIAFKSAMFHYKFYFFYKRKLLLFFESYGKINESDMR